MRYGSQHRSDGNQEAIVRALRKLGVEVQPLSGVGGGCPDLLVGIAGRNYLLEVKLPKGKLKPEQIKWHARWTGQVAVVHSAEDAIAWWTAIRVGTWKGL